jgi:hypothetical protein
VQPTESNPPEDAFEARAVASLLTKDRVFMEIYKKAARDDRIKAVTFAGRNYVVVRDPDIKAEILRLAPSITRYRHEPDSGRVTPNG